MGLLLCIYSYMEELYFSRKLVNKATIVDTTTNLYDKLDYFFDYKFYDLDHSYYYKGQKVEQSVTQLTGKFVEPFDKAKWLPLKAKERGITPEELECEWNKKAEISASTGTAFHKYMEEGLAGKQYTMRHDAQQEVLDRYIQLTPLADLFIKDSRNRYVPVKSEFIVGLDTRIAGQIDQLFYNKVTRKLDIFDWKTNKEINCWNKWHKRMLAPFNKLDDCELNSYSLQLSIYKYLLSLQGIEVDQMNIVWFNEKNKNYQVFPCKDLSNQVPEILGA